MSKIKARNTKPEMLVRRLLHRAGYRYRLHGRNLPGNPDLVFRARRKVIFVHGCFWHQHEAAECRDGRRPKSNTDYWGPKLTRNVERDRRALDELMKTGWNVLTIWECEIADTSTLAKLLVEFLGPARLRSDIG
jgi:DNA mismatch endonuclease (patch repair protein)